MATQLPQPRTVRNWIVLVAVAIIGLMLLGFVFKLIKGLAVLILFGLLVLFVISLFSNLFKKK